MKRRSMLHAALPLLAAWPRLLPAQAPARSARVGFVLGAAPHPATTRDIIEPFVHGLREAGFVEGRNLVIDYRWAEGKPERLPALVAELLAARPDLIVAAGSAPALAAKAATTAVPIVAAAVDNPVQMGLVPSMARPGGNITGISSFGGELVARRLQLLKDFVPQGRRFAVLGNPNYLDPAGLRKLLDRLEPQVGGAGEHGAGHRPRAVRRRVRRTDEPARRRRRRARRFHHLDAPRAAAAAGAGA